MIDGVGCDSILPFSIAVADEGALTAGNKRASPALLNRQRYARTRDRCKILTLQTPETKVKPFSVHLRQ
jgi:hypothetical protein